MDALAPSYAAVLTSLQLIPTLELTVVPAPDLDHVTSPWILLYARTHQVNADGWLRENIEAWDPPPQGVYLGSAHQLRIVRRAKPA